MILVDIRVLSISSCRVPSHSVLPPFPETRQEFYEKDEELKPGKKGNGFLASHARASNFFWLTGRNPFGPPGISLTLDQWAKLAEALPGIQNAIKQVEKAN